MAAENPMIAINRGGGRRVGTMQPLSGDNMGLLSSSSSHEGVAQELGLLLKGKSRHESILSKRDPLPHRSGSAPPIVEGSLAPMGQIFGSASTQQGNYFTPSGPTEGLDVVESELELRSDPAYLAYYYTHVKLNPRLPPPIISRESYWHAQHFVTSGMGERQKMGSNEGSGSKFPFPPQSGLSTHKEEMEPEPENVEEGGNFNKQVTDDWTDNNAAESLTGLLGGYGVKPKCLVDLIQEDFPRTPSPIYNLSRSSSRAANEDGTENAAEPSLLHTHSPVPNSGSVRVNSSNGPGRAASAPAGIKGVAQVQSIIAPDAGRNSANVAELCAALQEASVAEGKEREQAKHPTTSFPSQSQSQSASFQPASSQNIYAAMSHMAARNPFYQNLQPAALYASQYGLGSYPPSPNLTPTLIAGYPALPMGYDNAANLGAAMPFLGSSRGISGSFDPQQLYKYIGHAGNAMQSQLPDLMYLQYLQQQHSTGDARSYTSGNHIDPYDLHKSHAGGFTPDKKSQYPRTGSSGMPIVTKSGSVSPAAYYSSAPGVGYMIPYPSSPISSPVLPGSPVIPGGFSLRQTEINYQTPFGVGRSTAPYGWQSQRGSSPSEELMCFSLLEEMKTNKTRRFELLDIVGHVVEFSSDQHGSRFIQQKLETATAEEKAMVFREVLPQVLTLVTDVFGNYVIQKFFEHGITDQIAEIANQLVGHVLNLSLQMYGCRVIQKALEVVDVEQQTKLVSELDGHVIHCVRDQNGNHVIQKCIECIPADKIGFIISAFSGQVVVLSTHPYGCRVIQRVLEHCTDEQKGCGIMEEILHSACSLAQDQYGNYVVQHVLEHGSPRVRTELITKLVGQIVQMSHNKFASNVVEKCLEFGGVVGRQLLIAEMLGTTEENEVLQAMMKDQFANYVVQKVLEICDEDERELLLSRIRVHLPALKKYTYGKHIVARVEKLLVTGEQRDAQVSH